MKRRTCVGFALCWLAAAHGVTPAAPAQSPLVTLRSGTNMGNLGGGICFDLTIHTTVTITAIEFATGSNTVAGIGGLEVWLGPSSYLGNLGVPSLWSHVASATGVTVAPSSVAFGALDTPFALGPGSYGVALRANNCSHGYTNGVNCTNPTVPGACSNATFSTAEMTLRAGAAQNIFLTAPVFTPRVFNGSIHYVPGGNPIRLAGWEPFGAGCYAWYRSFYEWFGNPVLSFDLGNTSGGTNSLTLHFTGGGYMVFPFHTAGTFHVPTAAATDLGLGDNAIATVNLPWPLPYPMPGGPRTTTRLEACSNGFVSPAGSNGTAALPSVAAFLSGQPRWGTWFDFVPGSQGRISYEVDPSGQMVYVTWENVPDRGPSGLNTWQLAFASNGTVEFRWRAMATGGGGGTPALVGWTPGGGALDPDGIDLSASPAFSTGPTDNPPLRLQLSARPRLRTAPDFVTDGIPAGTIVGGVVFSTIGYVPGLPLDGLRMPGCAQYVNLGMGSPRLFAPNGTTGVVTLAIPGEPALEGAVFYAQSASFSSGYNALGVLASQGVRLVLGSL